MWCNNEKLSKKCGFDKYCDRFRNATYNQPINITLLVESLCIHCQRFLVDQLYPIIFRNFADVIRIRIVPFGNAHIKNGTFFCQHGEEECKINRYQSCLFDVIKSQNKFVPLMHCLEEQLMNNASFKNAKSICFANQSVSESIQEKIQKCFDSKCGDELQLEAANVTDNAWPDKKTSVPWVIINGVSLESLQDKINNLAPQLCEWYNGSKNISYCAEIADEAHKTKRSFLR
ncbi:unnamed protein product [Cylicocyclus nassatus]|uniref:Uncharacterized protein n=1 Tax=Cylicocyclus nassatus TaxID=53992 RepID=A0AA36H8K2_CYLNA|nr:unnamed protein product [Cylicocyclus nassatus]